MHSFVSYMTFVCRCTHIVIIYQKQLKNRITGSTWKSRCPLLSSTIENDQREAATFVNSEWLLFTDVLCVAIWFPWKSLGFSYIHTWTYILFKLWICNLTSAITWDRIGVLNLGKKMDCFSAHTGRLFPSVALQWQLSFTTQDVLFTKLLLPFWESKPACVCNILASLQVYLIQTLTGVDSQNGTEVFK